MTRNELIETLYVYVSTADKLLDAINIFQYEISIELEDLQMQVNSLRDRFMKCNEAISELPTYEQLTIYDFVPSNEHKFIPMYNPDGLNE